MKRSRSFARYVCVLAVALGPPAGGAPRLLAVPSSGQQIITTVAGGGPADNSSALEVGLGGPQDVAVDSEGNLFVSSPHLHRVLRIDVATGASTTVAGNGGYGFSGDGGAATRATLSRVYGLAVDAAGNLFIVDQDSARIRRVDPSGTITTVAGNGNSGYRGDGGPATNASFSTAVGLAADGAGNLFIADSNNHRVRRVDAAGIITTVAGNGISGFSGDGGPATSARLGRPSGLAVDAAGNLFIAEQLNHRVRRVDPGGTITTLAGNGLSAFSGDGGPATSAGVGDPVRVAVDAAGNVFITTHNRIRKVDPAGTITTIAGTIGGGFSGDGGPATKATLSSPHGVAVDHLGNLFIADTSNERIRQVDSIGTISTVAGNGSRGFSGDGGRAVIASLAHPGRVAFDGAGNLVIADSDNARIRRVDASGTITTVAGNGTHGFGGDGGPAASAKLSNPQGVAVDTAGNLYIADMHNQRVRRVDASGTITTIAGTGVAGFSGDGGLATGARLLNPIGVAVDKDGNLFIADLSNRRVRRVDESGIITTVAGNGINGFSGDGGPATSAALSDPLGLAVDGAGNLFIVDGSNQRLRRVDAAGTITTVAGTGALGFSGDGGPATSARLNNPLDVAVDTAGNIFVMDRGNRRIRRIGPSGTISTVAGNGISGFSGDGGPAVNASLAHGGTHSGTTQGVAVDGNGNLFIADSGNHRIRRVSAPQPEADEDGDGVLDASDNCPATANSDQANYDSDAQGDVCDTDDDNDGLPDPTDNCSMTPNVSQANADGDAQGDACDSDDDNDTVADVGDNCSVIANANQANTDGDAQGDACDPDDDNDTVADVTDNCALTANPGQENTDGDLQGDVCDADDDNDGVGDGADNCQFFSNGDQSDTDRDGNGNACDPDDDGDGVLDAGDNCPLVANEDQVDADRDAQGNVCDADDDNDSVPDTTDNCVFTPNPSQGDIDRDGQGDACEPFSFPTGGLFVIGDLTPHALGTTVNFWGAQWAKNNALSGGPAPSAFKGFENSNAVPACGATWTAGAGHSAAPPAAVSPYMAVVVTSHVTKSGSSVSGNVREIVIVYTHQGYGPNPGHAGIGTVVHTLCRNW